MNTHFDNIEDPVVPHNDELRSDNSFKVPTFYFESLTDRIMKKTEKNAVPSVLKETIFMVPTGYFESFTNRLMNKIQLQQTPKTVRTGFRKTWMYSAAAVLLILVTWMVIHLFNNPKQSDYLASSSEDDLLEYVSDHDYDFDQSSLATVMNEDELNSLNIFDDVDEDTTNMLIELYK